MRLVENMMAALLRAGWRRRRGGWRLVTTLARANGPVAVRFRSYQFQRLVAAVGASSPSSRTRSSPVACV